ncbi:MAG: hypothetical protein V2J20_00675 [Wenzhouxiangella sp.]|jgi:hypothetical protein|nr:hypothetical protein [Wenzhouxiangella sp.]
MRADRPQTLVERGFRSESDRADLTSFWHSLMPLLGVWLGGVVGMSFNFLVSRKLVFDA